MSFVWASLLHVLHGNRPYALSRTSHPITPFNPSGPFEYRSLYDRITRRIETALREELPAEFIKGRGIYSDFRAYAANTCDRFDAVITSPPFPGMRFDRPNWLRLWFCGWGEKHFHQESLTFIERQQMKSMDCYFDFYESMHRLLDDNGVLIVHAGNSDEMPTQLAARSKGRFALVADIAEDVTDVEKHGLPDKQRTTAHHFLFFRKI